MGPRLLGRGDRSISGLDQPQKSASMGPRLLGRGDVETSGGIRRETQRFNGAAAVRPRRLPFFRQIST